jgi:hypothetical protein
VDLARDRAVRLPAKLARLAAPLPAAQAALRVAQRTYARLRRSPPHGAAGQQLLATARARVTELLSVNYALERHDPAALSISTGTLNVIDLRLGDLGHRAGIRGC